MVARYGVSDHCGKQSFRIHGNLQVLPREFYVALIVSISAIFVRQAPWRS